MKTGLKQFDPVVLAALAASLFTVLGLAVLGFLGAGWLSLALVAATALVWGGLLGGALHLLRQRERERWQ
jgi:fatty acid desaturase